MYISHKDQKIKINQHNMQWLFNNIQANSANFHAIIIVALKQLQHH